MYYTGFADEAAVSLADQISATEALGWHCIESRCIDKVNIHDLPEAKFEEVCAQLAEHHISIDCFGSTIANWSYDPFDEAGYAECVEKLARAISRMHVLNCKKLRGMSFRAQWERPAFDPEVEKAVFPKLQRLVKMCEDGGVTYCHENCNNYGGQSYKHTLKLLDKIQSPAFKLIFDTGNPVFNYDRSEGDALVKRQDAWEFYRQVREFIVHVHIKDGYCDAEGVGAGQHFTFPGEGTARVPEILADLFKTGYDGGFSIEPHMVTVFHEAASAAANDRAGWENYVEYGRRLMALVETAKQTSKK